MNPHGPIHGNCAMIYGIFNQPFFMLGKTMSTIFVGCYSTQYTSYLKTIE